MQFNKTAPSTCPRHKPRDASDDQCAVGGNSGSNANQQAGVDTIPSFAPRESALSQPTLLLLWVSAGWRTTRVMVFGLIGDGSDAECR